ncbi:MAG: hypothetical protein AAF633_10950 [Chloroflexota bacterium]
MLKILIGTAVITVVSSPAFLYLWHVAAEKKKKSLQEAKAVSQRRRYDN